MKTLKIKILTFTFCFILVLANNQQNLPKQHHIVKSDLKFMSECTIEEKNEINSVEDGASKHGCVIACMMQKSGKINIDGDVNIYKFPKHIQSIVQDCKIKSEDGNKCTRALKLSNCIWDTINKNHIKIMKECAKETETDIDLSDITEVHRIWKDKEYACFNRCLLIKRKKINEENDFVITEEIGEEELKVHAKCIKENQQKNKCIQAVARETCVEKELLVNHGKKNHNLVNIIA